jgi:hypothetical protein
MKPGRPRKNPVPEPTPRNGIVHDPSSNDNMIEMSYDNPIIFKKVFSLLKNMNVKEINFYFTGTSVLLFGIDHLEKNNIHIKFNPNKMNHYFCERPVTVTIDTKNLDKITQKIDKNYDLISLILKKDSYRNNVIITLKNSTLSIDENHVVRLIESDRNYDSFVGRPLDYVNYPIKFELPCKFFKKLINDIYVFNEVFTIEKSSGPLSFTYKNITNTVKGYNICRDEKKINLVSTVTDIFSVSIQIDYLKAVSNSLLADNIKIYADSERDLVLNMTIDEAIDITSYVSINKYTV